MTNLKALKSVEESRRRDPAVLRWDAMICLLAKTYMASQGKSIQDVISDLEQVGLKDIEIANILGKTRSYISKELVQIRKKRK